MWEIGSVEGYDPSAFGLAHRDAGSSDHLHQRLFVRVKPGCHQNALEEVHRLWFGIGRQGLFDEDVTISDSFEIHQRSDQGRRGGRREELLRKQLIHKLSRNADLDEASGIQFHQLAGIVAPDRAVDIADQARAGKPRHNDLRSEGRAGVDLGNPLKLVLKHRVTGIGVDPKAFRPLPV